MAQEVRIKRSESPVRQRSLFWPIVLISIGAIWLLGNLGVISGANIAVLFRLWPLILIIVGIELLVGRNSPSVSALIGIGAVVLLVLLMLVGPSLGWAPNVEAKSATFSEPLADATSAQVDLNLGVADTTISALSDSSDLFSADLTYVGDVEFVAEGDTNKTISLSQTDEFDEGINLFSFGWFFNDESLSWNIGLNPEVPIDLSINGGVGEANLDLSGLQLSGLEIDGGVGQISVSLPSTLEDNQVRINGGVGEFDVNIPAGPNLTLGINGGVGEFTVDVPDDAYVTLNAEGGVGGVNLPPGYRCIENCDDGDFIGEKGTWVTEGQENAEQQAIVINYHGGVGTLNVR
jgi:hypothetical protein